MANVFDVAKYILSDVGDISTIKLQKLCYYCQAWNLVWRDAPLFNEDFQAWANGPVCDELFQIHKGKFIIGADNIPDDKLENNLTSEQILTINTIKEFYGKYSAAWLSELTHREQPWKETRTKAHVQDGDRCSAIISKELIKNYYSSL